MWLVNTGWIGGSYGTGKRIDIKYTRAIIDAIHSDSLDKVDTFVEPVFGFKVPTSCPGLPKGILNPRECWKDKILFDGTINKVANMFQENFSKFESLVNENFIKCSPITN